MDYKYLKFPGEVYPLKVKSELVKWNVNSNEVYKRNCSRDRHEVFPRRDSAMCFHTHGKLQFKTTRRDYLNNVSDFHFQHFLCTAYNAFFVS